jgi:hypothetical protein
LRRPDFRKRAAWLAALGLALCLLGPGNCWAEVLKVTQPNQSMFTDPDFAGTPIAAVPEGTEVNVLHQAGDWYKVDFAGKEGWMHRQSFPSAQPGKFNIGSLLFGAPAKEAKGDEVALAGKGFTPEVESSYRQKHPEANFAQVDRVEGNRVEPAKLQVFIKEGELKP